MAKSPELEAALRVMRANLFYTIQRKDSDGVWRSKRDIKPIKGQDAAYDCVRTLREEYPDYQWRVLKKDEADIYTQGLHAGIMLKSEHSHT